MADPVRFILDGREVEALPADPPTARSDRDMPAGVISIPVCYTEAAANRLAPLQLDPFGTIPEYMFCAARISAASCAA